MISELPASISSHLRLVLLFIHVCSSLIKFLGQAFNNPPRETIVASDKARVG